MVHAQLFYGVDFGLILADAIKQILLKIHISSRALVAVFLEVVYV